MAPVIWVVTKVPIRAGTPAGKRRVLPLVQQAFSTTLHRVVFAEVLIEMEVRMRKFWHAWPLRWTDGRMG